MSPCFLMSDITFYNPTPYFIGGENGCEILKMTKGTDRHIWLFCYRTYDVLSYKKPTKPVCHRLLSSTLKMGGLCFSLRLHFCLSVCNLFCLLRATIGPIVTKFGMVKVYDKSIHLMALIGVRSKVKVMVDLFRLLIVQKLLGQLSSNLVW